MAWLSPTVSFSRVHLLGLGRLAAFRVLLGGASILLLLSGSFAIFSFGRKVEMVQELVLASLRLSTLLGAALAAGHFAAVHRGRPALRQLSSPAQRQLGGLGGLLVGLLGLQLALLPAHLLALWLYDVPLRPYGILLPHLAAWLEGAVLLSVLLAAATRLGRRSVFLLAVPVVVAGQLAGALRESTEGLNRAIGWGLSLLPDLRLLNPSLYTDASTPFSGPTSLTTLSYATISVVIWACIGIMATEQ